MSELFPVIEATGKLPPQPWIDAPETRAVIAALTAGGADVRFVGGCVRDALAHRPVKDVDIATPDPPDRVMALLAAAGLKAIPTGLQHGTVTAVAGGAAFEVTTLRVDVTTDGRHAQVAFTGDWIADARRRDFTINTFSAASNGDVYDPFDALGDLAHGRVRFVGNPTQRIDEDVLRILRFFRFHAHYGRPPPDPEALAACRLRAHLLPRLSGERVQAELLRILDSPDPAGIVVLMRGVGALDQILPEAGAHGRNVGRLRMLHWLETTAIRLQSVGPDPLRRLAALLDTDAAGAAAAADRLRLSRADKDRLVAMAAPVVGVVAGMDDDSLRRALYRLGSAGVRDLALLSWAAERAVTSRPTPSRTAAWTAILVAAETWQPVAFPLKGRDALALGMSPGPAMGAALAAVETWWQDGGCRASREACLERLAAEARR